MLIMTSRGLQSASLFTDHWYITQFLVSESFQTNAGYKHLGSTNLHVS